MKISDSQTIKDIQKEFTSHFPGLKIEFYERSHGSYKASPKSALIPNEVIIGNIRSIHNEGDIELLPELTVNQVESQMKKIYGLNVQVFRKSKDLWLQTSTTDDWSLEKQNNKGLHSMDSDVKLYDNA